MTYGCDVNSTNVVRRSGRWRAAVPVSVQARGHEAVQAGLVPGVPEVSVRGKRGPAAQRDVACGRHIQCVSRQRSQIKDARLPDRNGVERPAVGTGEINHSKSVRQRAHVADEGRAAGASECAVGGGILHGGGDRHRTRRHGWLISPELPAGGVF